MGTNSAGVALGDHIKVGNSCVSVGSWSNTDHCYMGIALGYQSNTSNEPEKIHTSTAYSFCAGMGSRIKGAFCIGIGRGIYVEDGYRTILRPRFRLQRDNTGLQCHHERGSCGNLKGLA